MSWEELAALAAKEHDPEKLLTIVDQLCRAIDERNRNTISPTRKKIH